MKGKIVIEFTAKEAVTLLSSEATPKSLTNKIVKAFRTAQVTPQGAKAAIVARATSRAAKPATKGVSKTESEQPSVQ